MWFVIWLVGSYILIVCRWCSVFDSLYIKAVSDTKNLVASVKLKLMNCS